MTLYALDGVAPELSKNVWVAPGAHVLGRVTLHEGVSIWFGAVLRGDTEVIEIGAGSNVQDNVVIHADPGFPTRTGPGCTIGHRVMLHGCTIGANSLIGMGATVLNGARIGADCLIGAGALITEGKEIPDGSLVLGAPGRVARMLSEAEIERLRWSATHYQENASRFAAGLAVVR